MDTQRELLWIRSSANVYRCLEFSDTANRDITEAIDLGSSWKWQEVAIAKCIASFFSFFKFICMFVCFALVSTSPRESWVDKREEERAAVAGAAIIWATHIIWAFSAITLWLRITHYIKQCIPYKYSAIIRASSAITLWLHISHYIIYDLQGSKGI